MTIGNGQLTDADEVLRITKIDQVYTGNGFNSGTANATPDEQDHELTAVTSDDLVNANWAVVSISGTSSSSGASGTAETEVKAQIKETGQSYADISGYRTAGYTPNFTINASNTSIFTAPITAGMKTNGFQVKIFSKSTGNGTPKSASFANIQTTLEVKA